MEQPKEFMEHPFNEQEIVTIQLGLHTIMNLVEDQDNEVVKVARATYEKIALITGVTVDAVISRAAYLGVPISD